MRSNSLISMHDGRLREVSPPRPPLGTKTPARRVHPPQRGPSAHHRARPARPRAVSRAAPRSARPLPRGRRSSEDVARAALSCAAQRALDDERPLQRRGESLLPPQGVGEGGPRAGSARAGGSAAAPTPAGGPARPRALAPRRASHAPPPNPPAPAATSHPRPHPPSQPAASAAPPRHPPPDGTISQTSWSAGSGATAFNPWGQISALPLAAAMGGSSLDLLRDDGDDASPAWLDPDNKAALLQALRHGGSGSTGLLPAVAQLATGAGRAQASSGGGGGGGLRYLNCGPNLIVKPSLKRPRPVRLRVTRWCRAATSYARARKLPLPPRSLASFSSTHCPAPTLPILSRSARAVAVPRCPRQRWGPSRTTMTAAMSAAA